jgi:hypothetical protein
MVHQVPNIGVFETLQECFSELCCKVFIFVIYVREIIYFLLINKTGKPYLQ